jgi:hypothetical protein
MKPRLHPSTFLFVLVALVAAAPLAPRMTAGPPLPTPGAARQGQAAAPEGPRFGDFDQRLGPFSIGGAAYSVLLHKKRLLGPKQENLGEALAELEIQDADGNPDYQETFDYQAEQGRLTHSVSASAGLFAGQGGAALAIRLVEMPAATPGGESWQMFGLVNGKLASFGAPLPLGQDPGNAVGGVLAGVMLRGGIGVQAMGSTSEALEFRVWEGNFNVLIPVRVDWQHGKWTEEEECFESFNGTLRPKGCNLRVEANPLPRGADSTAVRLFPETEDDPYASKNVVVRADSQVAFLSTRALVTWMESDQRISCSFDDVWLRVRIDGAEGWVHSEDDFAALGLPARNESAGAEPATPAAVPPGANSE